MAKKETSEKKSEEKSASNAGSAAAPVNEAVSKKTIAKKKSTTEVVKKDQVAAKASESKPEVGEKSPEKAPKEKTAEELAKEEEEKKEKEERLVNYKKAGEIAKKVKDYMRPKIVVGAKLLKLIEEAEAKIIEFGGKPGFPVNISINNVASHYTSTPDDQSVIQDGDIVKFDLGVHIDGYSVDTAFTVNLNKEDSLKNMHKASEEAVAAAIKMMKPGTKVNQMGAEIEKVVKSHGFKVISNLQGHKLDRWSIHAGKSIPCIAMPTPGEPIEEGEVFAVEVFATNGEGIVHAQTNVYIFSLDSSIKKVPLRVKSSRHILSYIVKEFVTLPFSKYQIHKEFPNSSFGLLELIKTGKLIKHNVLAEKKGFYVAQCEETVLITKDGYQILT